MQIKSENFYIKKFDVEFNQKIVSSNTKFHRHQRYQATHVVKNYQIFELK